jgi:hypothetical protein
VKRAPAAAAGCLRLQAAAAAARERATLSSPPSSFSKEWPSSFSTLALIFQDSASFFSQKKRKPFSAQGLRCCLRRVAEVALAA